jgi:hypothetical protein
VKLDSTDYTATNGSDVVLASGAASGDIVEVVAFSAFEAANALPSQTGNNGKYLTTDGSSSSWGTVDLSTKVSKTGDTMTGNLDVTGTVTADGASLDGAVVINEAGADVDFRVESDTKTHALFLEGSSGNVGIWTESPTAQLHVYGPNFPLARIERHTSLTTGMRSTFSAIHTTSGDMTDGFGADVSFGIRDSAGVDNEIANFGAIRDGADNSGALVFATTLNGTQQGTPKMILKSSGSVGIGTTNPVGKLDVRGEQDFVNQNGINDSGAINAVSDLDTNNGASAVASVTFKAPYATGNSDRVVYGAISGNKENSIQGYRHGQLKFYTNNNTSVQERMRIDSAGRVTMPYQPSFKVRSGGFTKTNVWQLISPSMTTVNRNLGGHWSSSTGRFTAPVAGTYLFFFGGWSNASNDGARYATSFQVNGGGATYISGSNYCDTDSPLNGHSEIIYLNANDYVELYAFSAISCTWGGGHSVFWGGQLLG